MFANPPPGAGELAALHRDQYAGKNEPERLGRLDPEKAWKRQFSSGFQRWARNLLGRLASLGALSRPRLLEVGCACGGVLQAAGELGYPAVGVEISRAAAARGIEEKALDIRIGTLAEMEFEPRSFQIVLLLDVLEHVASPRSLLDECARLLAPGGILCIQTVNLASLTAARAGWRFYLADTGAGHAVLFTPGHLRGFLQAAGFELLSLETRGFRIVQRERDRRTLGWKRPFLRLAENLGHEWGKRTGRGHFLLAIARCGRKAATISP